MFECCHLQITWSYWTSRLIGFVHWCAAWIKLRSRSLLCFRLLLTVMLLAEKTRACFLHSVDGFYALFPLKPHASHSLRFLLNTLKYCRRSRSPRRRCQSRPARLLPLCPGSSSTGSPVTSRRRWRSELPPKHLRASGRVGEADSLQSLENLTSNRWVEKKVNTLWTVSLLFPMWNNLMSPLTVDEFCQWREATQHRVPTCRASFHLDADVWDQRCKWAWSGTTVLEHLMWVRRSS